MIFFFDVLVWQLCDVEQSGQVIVLLCDIFGVDNVDVVYVIQCLNVQYYVVYGWWVVGCKVGLIYFKVQQQLGVNQLDFGILFVDMCYGDNVEVLFGCVLQFKVEVEIVLVLKQDLLYVDIIFDELYNVIEWVLLVFEVVGSCICDWLIGFVDIVVDNVFCGLYVIGGLVQCLVGLDLKQCVMYMICNQELVFSGCGSECLGYLLNVVVWLVCKLVSFGELLWVGDIVLIGVLGLMVMINEGDSFVVYIEGIGLVVVCFVVVGEGDCDV